MPKVLYHGRQLSSQYYAIIIFDFKELVRLATGVRSNQCDQIGRFFALWATFLKPLATINLPKSLKFLGNFCKGVKIYHFLATFISTFGDFFLVTLNSCA